MSIINLTQHQATEDQIKAGVFNLEGNLLKRLLTFLTFEEIPNYAILAASAAEIAEIASNANAKKAMIGGAPFFMGHLEKALKEAGIQPLYAFSKREVVESTSNEGTVVKTAIFRHVGFVPA
jgi:hypothetical protein